MAEKITLTIMADFGGAFCWRTRGDAEVIDGVGSCSDLPMVHQGMRMHRHPLTAAFERWQSRFERIPHGECEKFDWRSFNAEGIALARRLKASVGEKMRIIYEKAYEDSTKDHQERREVMADGELIELPNREAVNAAAAARRTAAKTHGE